MDDHRELWLKVHDTLAVQEVILTVVKGQCLVSESTLASLMGNRGSTVPEDEPTWHVTYEVMRELLVMNDFYKWPPPRE